MEVVVGQEPGDTGFIPSSPSLYVVFWDCFGLYHSQQQQALILFDLSSCSSNANKSW